MQTKRVEGARMEGTGKKFQTLGSTHSALLFLALLSVFLSPFPSIYLSGFLKFVLPLLHNHIAFLTVLVTVSVRLLHSLLHPLPLAVQPQILASLAIQVLLPRLSRRNYRFNNY
jgi:hypothetical protein